MSARITRPALALLLVAIAGSTSCMSPPSEGQTPVAAVVPAPVYVQQPVVVTQPLPAPAASPVVVQQPVIAQGPVAAEQPAPAPAPSPAAPWPGTPAQPPVAAAPAMSATDLDTMLGPIALYPDPLLAQILAATTYPLDVVQASRWAAQHPDLAGLDDQPWDPSVRAVARFKSVLGMMDQNLDWTAQLGRAFTQDPEGVMSSVQRLRAKAVAAGSLGPTPQQQVIVEREVVRIVPAEPQVVYVPVYDPRVVYVEPVVVDPYPVAYCPPRWYAPVWDGPCVATGTLISFSVGYSWGRWSDLDCDWHHRRVYYRDWHRGSDHDDDHGRGRSHDGRDGRDDGDRRGNFRENAGAGVPRLALNDAPAAPRDGTAWRRQDSPRPVRTGTFAGLTPQAVAGPARETRGLDAGGSPGKDARRPAPASPPPDRAAAEEPARQRTQAVLPRVAPADSPAPPSAAPSATPSRRGSFALPDQSRSVTAPVPQASPAPLPARVIPAPAARSASPTPAPKGAGFGSGASTTRVEGPSRAAPASSSAPVRAAPSAPAPNPVSGPKRADSDPAPPAPSRAGTFNRGGGDPRQR